MNFMDIASSWADAVLKAGKWAPGPNAGWRRLDDTTPGAGANEPKRQSPPRSLLSASDEESAEILAERARREQAAHQAGTRQPGHYDPVLVRQMEADGNEKRLEEYIQAVDDEGTAYRDYLAAKQRVAHQAHYAGNPEGEEDLSDEEQKSRVHKNIRMLVPIDKSATPQRITYGVVLEPDTEDLQGDIMSAEDIEEAAYDWMERSQAGGHMHSETVDGAKVVESYIAPCDIPVETAEGPETIRKGSWVLGMRWPENIWKRIAGGELTGYSVGGTGVRLAMEDVDKAALGRMGGPRI